MFPHKMNKHDLDVIPHDLMQYLLVDHYYDHFYKIITKLPDTRLTTLLVKREST